MVAVAPAKVMRKRCSGYVDRKRCRSRPCFHLSTKLSSTTCRHHTCEKFHAPALDQRRVLTHPPQRCSQFVAQQSVLTSPADLPSRCSPMLFRLRSLCTL